MAYNVSESSAVILQIHTLQHGIHRGWSEENPLARPSCRQTSCSHLFQWIRDTR